MRSHYRGVFNAHVSLLHQALLTARQEKEIQLKMLITKGESVQRNTSAEGVPVLQKQIQDLKDSWDALLSASIQCKRLILYHKQYLRMCFKLPFCSFTATVVSAKGFS